MPTRLRSLIPAIVLVFSTVVGFWALNGSAHHASPALIIWAWERDRDMKFVRAGDASIAYYAGTIVIKNGRAFWKPRLSILKMPDKPMPVVRIECLSLTVDQPAAKVAEPIVELVTRLHSPSVQIDFDAREDERKFYCRLISELRRKLPRGTRISVTALASWCLDDAWLDDLHADEAVVMLFSMGGERQRTLESLARRKFNVGYMRLAVGVSANEHDTNRRLKSLGIIGGAPVVYVFNALPWTDRRFQSWREEAL